MVIIIDLNGNDDEIKVVDQRDKQLAALEEEQKRAEWVEWYKKTHQIDTQIIPVKNV